jgi:hypothetical protein
MPGHGDLSSLAMVGFVDLRAAAAILLLSQRSRCDRTRYINSRFGCAVPVAADRLSESADGRSFLQSRAHQRRSLAKSARRNFAAEPFNTRERGPASELRSLFYAASKRRSAAQCSGRSMECCLRVGLCRHLIAVSCSGACRRQNMSNGSQFRGAACRRMHPAKHALVRAGELPGMA